MALKRMEIEVKVGLFVSIGLFLTLLSILVLGSSQNFLSKKSHYLLHFNNVEGLIEGAKVVLGGVRIGTVDSIAFDMKTRDVSVQIGISNEAMQWIREDCSAEIATQGLLGDKFISINPGTEGAPPLKPGSQIPVVTSQGLSQVISKSDQLLVSLNTIAASMERLLKGFEAGNRSETFFSGMASTARNLSQASEKLNKEMDDVKLKRVVKNLETITEKINNGTGTLGALVNDPGLYDNAKSLVGEANRNRIVRNLVRKTLQDSEKEREKTEKEAAEKGTGKK